MPNLKVNPFSPGSPVNAGMFVGRLHELRRLKTCLLQTRAGRPHHFLITGERGIGKSSLLNYIKWTAEGRIPLDGEHLSFLVLDTDVDSGTTRLGLIEKIRLALECALAKTESARSLLKDAWSFLQRVEAAGVGIRAAVAHESEDLILEKFSYTLADVAARVVSKDASLFGASYEGILILIDEADRAPSTLGLGALLKQLTERLQRRGCTSIVIGLAGLPDVRTALSISHASSLRLFEELVLGRLSDAEVNGAIDLCLDEANRINPKATVLTDDGRHSLVFFSEGYPHFIQQFGFSAFAMDANDSIDSGDVLNGAFGEGGALEMIGERYYRHKFFNKIQSAQYRQVLRIMAESGDGWVSKATLRASFKGNATTLTNAIKALLAREITPVQDRSVIA